MVPTTNRLSVSDKFSMAQSLANAGLLPKHYQKNPANLLWAIEYAEALGVHPMTAVNGIHVIDGKPTASAQLIGGLVRRAGHKLRVTFDRKNMVATAQVIRVDDPEFTFESVWSLDRAKAAGLAGKNVWRQYPDAMLKARAITEVARDAAPEALYGVIYTPEELGAEVRLDADGEIVEVIETQIVVSARDAKIRLLEACGGDKELARATWELVIGDATSNAPITEEQLAEVLAAGDKALATDTADKIADAIEVGADTEEEI